MKIIIKVIKILLIIMVYVIMFWGLFKWLSYPFIHKTEPNKCECTCNCDKTKIVSDEIKNTEVFEAKELNVKKTTTKIISTKKIITTKKVKKTDIDIYKNFAYDLVINQYLWSEDDYKALVKLWTKESGWDPNAVNKSSGACNIPQALPCNKISKEYGNNSWKSGIKWGLAYIEKRYGNPKKAWQHFQNKNWY